MTTLLSYLLLEGGNALKAHPITQAEFHRIKDGLIHHIIDYLDLPITKIKFIGSAGKKPNATDISGDIDIAVEIDKDIVATTLQQLANNNSYRAMPGINVYSFGYPVDDKLVQVDLMPVSNVKYAEWAMQAHPRDLKRGLKGAHRNELLFAIAKNADYEIKQRDSSGSPTEIERYFFDLSRGLFRGTQSRISKSGKLKKNFITVNRQLVTTDPNYITKLFFGDHVRAVNVQTYYDTLAMINDKQFKHINIRDKIIKQAIDGIAKKGLVQP